MGCLRVVEQRARGADGGSEPVRTEAGEIPRPEVLRQGSHRALLVEVPGRERLHRNASRLRAGKRHPVRDQQLRGSEPLQLGLQARHARLHDRERAGSEIERGDAQHTIAQRHGRQHAVTLFVEERGVGQRAGRDHAHDLALDRSFRLGGIAKLLADGDRLSARDQLCEVLLDRVERHPRHRDRFARGSATRREGDVEQPRRLLRILEEKLVEVPHAVEEQHVGTFRLEAQILLHHRRVGGRAANLRRSRRCAGMGRRSAIGCFRVRGDDDGSPRPQRKHEDYH